MTYSRFAMRGIADPSPVGRRIVALTTGRGDALVARVAAKLGVSANYVRSIIRGDVEMNRKLLTRFAAAYSLTPAAQAGLTGRGIEPTPLSAIVAGLRARIQASGKTQVQVASAAGMSSANLSITLSGKHDPRAATIAKIEAAIDA